MGYNKGVDDDGTRRSEDTGVATLSKAFKALSDGTRRKILELLKEGDLNAGQIAEHFSVSKPSISHHLNILKEAEFVQERREGQNIIYTLVPENIHECCVVYLAKLMVRGTKKEEKKEKVTKET